MFILKDSNLLYNELKKRNILKKPVYEYSKEDICVLEEILSMCCVKEEKEDAIKRLSDNESEAQDQRVDEIRIELMRKISCLINILEKAKMVYSSQDKIKINYYCIDFANDVIDNVLNYLKKYLQIE